MNDESKLFSTISTYLASQDGKQPPANEVHQFSMQKFAEWLKMRGKRKSEVVVICTGNSRRSMLTSTLGNVIAAYRKWPEVHFHSAGTAPSAFNVRTIAALKQIGVEITETGSQAKSGKKGEKNPHYKVQWGKDKHAYSLEYSKALGDVSLPGNEFAALIVCSDADKECPVVEGAAIRVALPFDDPKAYDGKPNESDEYAKTRDLIAQTLLLIKI